MANYIDNLKSLQGKLSGTLEFDDTYRSIYATDASVYRQKPLAVAFPKQNEDIVELIKFANRFQIPLIPRAAGTSLAGQAIGAGIVVDVSRYFSSILEINQQQSWVSVQPGVVRDELNKHLKDSGLFFPPETATSNRATIGGMIGNNSCGANSIVYGSVREHLLELKGFLSDGTYVTFGDISERELKNLAAGLTSGSKLEHHIYRHIYDLLSDPRTRHEIHSGFPDREIRRRNTGYALDILASCAPFEPKGPKFNLCNLIAGSEGTLFFITEAKLRLSICPPTHRGLLCIHFHSVENALNAAIETIKFGPIGCELVDHHILECTKSNLEQAENRVFIQGDPQALLVVDLACDSAEKLEHKRSGIVSHLESRGLGYFFPFITGEDQQKVWSLRKAGLGVLSTMRGDAKPIAVIEDTAVKVEDLPSYIVEVETLLLKHGLQCVKYAHAGDGELHLRPIIDLKSPEGKKVFRDLAEDVAKLVKRYKGSLSGEHGDGRLRGEFIPLMIGSENYQRLVTIKETWDPNGIFNPEKITNARPMDTDLRFNSSSEAAEFETVFAFKKEQGLLRAAELCNGSGDCRKSALIGGTMCPSFMASKEEPDTTRARANIVREVLAHRNSENPFLDPRLHSVLDRCLSCKGCKRECPSSVDVAKIKAELTHQKHQAKGIPLETRLMSLFPSAYGLGSLAPRYFNALLRNGPFRGITNSILKIHPARSLPEVGTQTVTSWFRKNQAKLTTQSGPALYLFLDEITNLIDSAIGIQVIQLLNGLGFRVALAPLKNSARLLISEGLLKQARECATKNVLWARDHISSEIPLVGIEPSTILGFRDEYPELVPRQLSNTASRVAAHCLTFEEFVANQFELGVITPEHFTTDPLTIEVHGHCHQKALSQFHLVKKALEIPTNFTANLIPSGCCGMAGSFGYRLRHYELSQQIGNLILFPHIEKLSPQVVIAASGTSCRHQILDGTGRRALHTAEILYNALTLETGHQNLADS